jgi:hypothetical protein
LKIFLVKNGQAACEHAVPRQCECEMSLFRIVSHGRLPWLFEAHRFAVEPEIFIVRPASALGSGITLVLAGACRIRERQAAIKKRCRPTLL